MMARSICRTLTLTLPSTDQDEGALTAAAKYCSRLLECGGAEEEWAKGMLKEIRGLERR